MRSIGYFEFIKQLNQNSLQLPVIVLSGYNEFLGKNIIEKITENFLEGRSEFNYRRYYFDSDSESSSTLSEVLNDASSANFFLQSRKILVLTIRDKKRITFSKDESAQLMDYLNSPNPNTILLIYISLDLMRDDFVREKRSKIDRFIKAYNSNNIIHVDLDKISEKEIKLFIKTDLKEKGISITASALEKLSDLKGDDLPSTLGQMSLFEIISGGENVIDTEDIDMLVTGVGTHSIWDLTEAVEKEDISKYLNVLKYLFINGIKAPLIIGTLITHYSKIYTAKFLLRSNFSTADIGKILGQPSYFLNRFIKSVKSFSDAKLLSILDLIYKIDMTAKSGSEETTKLSLQNFIFQITVNSKK